MKVVELKVILERTNMDGSTLRIGEALVGDETGTILLTCRNGEIMGQRAEMRDQTRASI